MCALWATLTADGRLFVGRKGDLYVLLSTRSGELRTYAHDTALPGGKYEEGDEDEEGTAVGVCSGDADSSGARHLRR